jgi:hypothetical protein
VISVVTAAAAVISIVHEGSFGFLALWVLDFSRHPAARSA